MWYCPEPEELQVSTVLIHFISLIKILELSRVSALNFKLTGIFNFLIVLLFLIEPTFYNLS